MSLAKIRYGSIGREHLENSKAMPGTEVTALSDTDAQSLAQVLQLLPDAPPAFVNSRDLLDSVLVRSSL